VFSVARRVRGFRACDGSREEGEAVVTAKNKLPRRGVGRRPVGEPSAIWRVIEAELRARGRDVDWLAGRAGVARSTIYRWRAHPPRATALARRAVERVLRVSLP
jgi:hypothetical protein